MRHLKRNEWRQVIEDEDNEVEEAKEADLCYYDMERCASLDTSTRKKPAVVKQIKQVKQLTQDNHFITSNKASKQSNQAKCNDVSMYIQEESDSLEEQPQHQESQESQENPEKPVACEASALDDLAAFNRAIRNMTLKPRSSPKHVEEPQEPQEPQEPRESTFMSTYCVIC